MSHRRAKRAVKTFHESRAIVGIEDMVLLQDIQDRSIVSNLAVRLQASQIYTFIGHVLVVCNPYKWLPIYEEHVIKQYILQQRVDVPPHIFATAEAAYRTMINEEDNQCLIISGESGAGKTEASKQIQSYIATISNGGENVKKVFLESNPVLEAFGNAKTLRNNNSSRFGKYFELMFDRSGRPTGGIITNYLLEKIRISKPGQGERNFHIFYQLVASSQSEQLGLTAGAGAFNYLKVSGCSTVDGVNDAEEFEVTMEAMKKVGMKKPQISAILSVIGAILHLGNVGFKPKAVGNTEGCEVIEGPNFAKACELLKIDPRALKTVLTFRELKTMAPGGKVDVYQVPQQPSQAASRRDSIAKALYSRVFDLIVTRINAAMQPPETKDSNSIGVLDIYGFEVFETNGFEQLCINYVNEKLQQIFIELTLNAEQQEYAAEGIAWKAIPFFNNKIVCELLDAAKPAGIFRILDDTCKTMHGTSETSEVDAKFLDFSKQIHGSHKHFRSSTGLFTIKHYAGDVSYSLGKLAESNKDSLSLELVLLLQSSQAPLVQHIFPVDENTATETGKIPSAGNRIRTQCAELVTSLMKCSPHYVRCIKSNDRKASLSIDQDRVQHQVKYLGLCENIKVRRAGFAYRSEYHRFLDRFAILSKATYPEWHGTELNGCKEIMKEIKRRMTGGLPAEEVQFGKNKIFIRLPEVYFGIEKLRESALESFVCKIQRTWRRYKSSFEYLLLQEALSEFYISRNKLRRRDSIYRPFRGDYVDELPVDRRTDYRDGLYKIVDYYNENETVVFVDPSCQRIVLSNASKCGWDIVPCFLVLTSDALYLLDVITESSWQKALTKQAIKTKKALPNCLFLQLRIPLGRQSGVYLSKYADHCVVVKVKPEDVGSVSKKAIWKPNHASENCAVTGQPFGFFQRKHHCRVSGNLVIDNVSNYKQLLPELGWGTPQRVSDPYIGLCGSDPLEDVILLTTRKSELAGLLVAEERKFRKLGPKNNDRKELKQFYGEATHGIQVVDKVEVSSPVSSAIASLSRLPCSQVSFAFNSSSKTVAAKDDVLLSVTGSGSGKQLNVTAFEGLNEQAVKDRRQRQLERKRRAEKRRKAAEAARQQRAQEKEERREAERQRHLAEKKALKAAERERQQQLEEQKEKCSKLKSASSRPAIAAKITSTNHGNAVSSSASSELAAAMAKRRSKIN